MSTPIYSYWGKASREVLALSLSNGSAEKNHHLLPYHCLDVAAAAETWWQQDTALRRLFVRAGGTDEPRLRAWLLFFTTLHDLGKFDARFQWKAPATARLLKPEFEKQLDLSSTPAFNHGAAGYAWFCKEIEAYGFAKYADNAHNAHEWMKAVAGHHGGNPEQNPPNTAGFAAPAVLQHDHQARIEWVTALRAAFLEPADIASGEEPPLLPVKLLAGFCSVADWVGSNADYFDYQDRPDIPLAAYLDSRREIAERALRDFGLYRPALLQGGMDIFPDKTPRGVQTLVERLPVEPGLTLIEAPTGSGKTEAALAYASRLLAEGLADSLIFALPSQATSNAMLDRFVNRDHIGARLFPGTAHDIVLAHGKKQFNQDFKQLKQAAARPTAQREEEALSQCSQWLAASRKRVFLGQIGLCTIDQVLLSVLPIRHHFVRAFGVHKSVLVIDEIHAYDWYMYGLLSCLLYEQARAGGSVVLLSATLPESTKSALFAAWKQGKKPEVSGAYPLITHVGATPVALDFPCPAQPERPERSVAFTVHASPDVLPGAELLQAIIQAAGQGAKVAIVCNLVNDAQNLWQGLRVALPDNSPIALDLFHARFRFADRQGIEQQVLRDYGKDAPPGGRILVATQVVEQSLDLDFDWLITQLCPVDLLFQRLGRLHRHTHSTSSGQARPRPPGFESPRCTVLAPESDDYGLHALLYGAASLLWRTRQFVEQNGRADFPDAYRDWIERVYQQDAWPGEPPALVNAYQKHLDENLGKLYGGKAMCNANTQFSDDEDNPHVLAMTRDGEMSLTVYPCTVGRRAFLDSTAFDSLDEWQWEEQLNLNGVSVLASWQKYLSTSPDPKNKKIPRYFLEMRAAGEGEWTAEGKGCRFIYTARKGLQRIDE